MLARKDLADSGALRTPADLRGRKIALVSKGSTVEYFVDSVLRKGSPQSTDVEYVEMGFGEMGAAFARGPIDAAVGGEPTSTSYVDKGLASRWLCSADVIPNFQYTYVLYGPRFASEQTDVAQRWMTAYLRGARDWQMMLDTGAGKEEIFSYLTRYTTIKNPAVLERVNLSVMAPNGLIDGVNIRNQMSWARARDYVENEPSTDAFVDPRFVEHAARSEGHRE